MEIDDTCESMVEDIQAYFTSLVGGKDFGDIRVFESNRTTISNTNGQKHFSSVDMYGKKNKVKPFIKADIGAEIKNALFNANKQINNCSVSSSIRYGSKKFSIANTNGTSANWSTPYVRFAVTARAGKDVSSASSTIVQQATDLNHLNIANLTETALNNAISTNAARRVGRLKGQVILSKFTAALLIRALIHAISCNNILAGDSFIKKCRS